MREHAGRAFGLENMLKNVVIEKLVEIRVRKNTKTLKESIEDILKVQHEEEAKKRMKMKKTIMRGYEKK